jgi:hypothetical protein
MKQEASIIFVRRAGPDASMRPSKEELASFLERMKKQGALAPLVTAMGKARMMLIDMAAFEDRRKLEPWQQDHRERMVYGVLRHSRFVCNELLNAVAEFQYQLRILASLDFAGPEEFIANAEQTLKKLKRSNIDHVVRMVRLKEMIGERRHMLAGLESRQTALISELRHIASYVRENLVLMETLCRKAIVVLVEIGLDRSMENELIEAVRKQFHQELRAASGVRQLTTDDLERAKHIANRLAQKLSDLVRDDVFSLSQLYETVHDVAKSTAEELTELLREVDRSRIGQERGVVESFQKIGQALVLLVVGFPDELRPKKADIGLTRNALLMDKRREMVEYLFEQTGLERRARSDRRAAPDRRRAKDPGYAGPERRSGKGRRTRAGRRTGY